MDHSCWAPCTVATATSHGCSLMPVLVIYTFLCRLWKHSGLTKGKSNSACFDWGRLIFIRDRMAHFYLFSSWKSKKWEVKPASPWQPLQRGFLSRWRGVIMELKFLPVHSRWAFCFVFPCCFPLGPCKVWPHGFFRGWRITQPCSVWDQSLVLQCLDTGGVYINHMKKGVVRDSHGRSNIPSDAFPALL